MDSHFQRVVIILTDMSMVPTIVPSLMAVVLGNMGPVGMDALPAFNGHTRRQTQDLLKTSIFGK